MTCVWNKSFDEFCTRADGQTSVHIAFYESRVNEDVCELYMAQLLQEGDIEWGAACAERHAVKICGGTRQGRYHQGPRRDTRPFR